MKTVAIPARAPASATAEATASVMSCASFCPFVDTSRRFDAFKVLVAQDAATAAELFAKGLATAKKKAAAKK